MTTEEDLRKNGWNQNSDKTWSNPNTDQKLLTQTGDTGQVYTKPLGGSQNGYGPYNPNDDSSKR